MGAVSGASQKSAGVHAHWRCCHVEAKGVGRADGRFPVGAQARGLALHRLLSRAGNRLFSREVARRNREEDTVASRFLEGRLLFELKACLLVGAGLNPWFL